MKVDETNLEAAHLAIYLCEAYYYSYPHRFACICELMTQCVMRAISGEFDTDLSTRCWFKFGLRALCEDMPHNPKKPADMNIPDQDRERMIASFKELCRAILLWTKKNPLWVDAKGNKRLKPGCENYLEDGVIAFVSGNDPFYRAFWDNVLAPLRGGVRFDGTMLTKCGHFDLIFDLDREMEMTVFKPWALRELVEAIDDKRPKYSLAPFWLREQLEKCRKFVEDEHGKKEAEFPF